MADVNQAFQFTMHNECQVNPDGSFVGTTITDIDGGMTRYGVDSNAHKEAVTDGFYTMSDADALTYAFHVFQYSYFNPVIGYLIESQIIASKFADLAFNEYIHEATLIVQRAVNSLRDANNQITVDGKPGSQTVTAINGLDEAGLFSAIVEQGTEFYTGLQQSHPDKYSEAVLKAWIKRLEKVPPSS